MQGQPRVSVLVPTYQHKDYIATCLESILAQQTDFPVEILVGEDGSTDGTRDVCRDVASAHPGRISLFERDRKDVIHIMGRPTGRANLIDLLRAARGEYIALCEGDDYWTDPLKLQKQVDFLDANEDHVVTYHDARVEDGNGKVLQASKIPAGMGRDHSAEELLLNKTFILTLSVVFRNHPSYRDEPPEEFRVIPNGDNFITSRLGLLGKGKYMGDIAPAVYRQHGGGVWSPLGQSSRDLAQMNSWMWMAAYYNRIGRADVARHFIDRVGRRAKEMAEWQQLRHRKAYRLFARLMRLAGVTLPR